MNDVEMRYYRHPSYPRDFVRITSRGDGYQWDWQKEVVEKGPEYVDGHEHGPLFEFRRRVLNDGRNA